MEESSQLLRSPELMDRHDTALVVVDVQEKLARLIAGWQRMVWNIGRLVDGARLLAVPVLASEQYRKGLGGTVAELAERVGPAVDKREFSCTSCKPFVEQLAALARPKTLVVGIETHVCIQQTVLDLLAAGQRVYVAADATGSRFAVDREFALRRMEAAGATITTVEAALFEWCATSEAAEFKQLSALVRQPPPKPTDTEEENPK